MGVEPEDVATPPPPSPQAGAEGSEANVDEIVKKQADSMTAIMRATEEIVRRKIQVAKQFLDGEITTREEFNDRLLEQQAKFLTQALELTF